MRRLLVTVLASLAALLAVLVGGLPMASKTVATPTLHMPTYAHDSQHPHAVSADTAPERGPPTAATPLATYDAVDRGLHGASARSGRVAPSFAYTYDDPAKVVQVVGSAARGTGVSRGTQLTLVLSPRSHVAANTGAELANGGARLDWSLVSKSGETRAAHVALHEAENASKMAHGVFLGDSQALTNEAWSIAQARGITPITEGGVDIYRVPMGRNVGYAGGANAGEMAQVPHRTIEIITREGTNELITAYPVPLG